MPARLNISRTISTAMPSMLSSWAKFLPLIAMLYGGKFSVSRTML